MLMHSAPPRHEASSAEFIEILPEAPFTGAEVQDLTEILPSPRLKPCRRVFRWFWRKNWPPALLSLPKASPDGRRS